MTTDTSNIVLNLSGNWKESMRQIEVEAQKVSKAFGDIDDVVGETFANWAQTQAELIKRSTSGLDDLRSAVEEVGDGLESLRGKSGARIRDAILDNVDAPEQRLKLFNRELNQELTGTGPAALRSLRPLNDALGRSAAEFEILKAKAGPAGEVAINVLRGMGIEATSMASLVSSAGVLAIGALGGLALAAGGAALALGVGGLASSVREYVKSSEEATERAELFEAQTTALQVSVGKLTYDVLGLEDALSGLTFGTGIVVDKVSQLDSGTVQLADQFVDLGLKATPLGDVFVSLKDLGGGVLTVFSSLSDEGDRLAQSVKGASDEYESFNKQLERSIKLADDANKAGAQDSGLGDRLAQQRGRQASSAATLSRGALPKKQGSPKRKSIEPARNRASSLVSGAIQFGDSNSEALFDFARTDTELPFLIGDVRAAFDPLAAVVAAETSPQGNRRRGERAEEIAASKGLAGSDFDKQISRLKALGGVLDDAKGAATGFGVALSEALAGLASGGLTLNNFGSAIRGAFGSLWSDLGRGFVAQGIALGFAGDFAGGAALVAAGIGLQATAGLVSGKGRAGGGAAPSAPSEVSRSATSLARDLRGGRDSAREEVLVLRVDDEDIRAHRRRKAADDARRGWGVAA